MPHKSLFTVLLLTFALTLLGAQHNLGKTAPNALPFLKETPPLQVVAANDARQTVLAAPKLPEPNPAHVTLVIAYAGPSPSAELIKALTELQTAQRISALDAASAPGRIFVLGDQLTILALRDAPGVNAITEAGESNSLSARASGQENSLRPPFVTIGVTGTISGQVTAQGSGAPLFNIYAALYDASSGKKRYSTTTDAAGAYRLDKLAPGDYKLEFYDYIGVFATQAFDFSSAAVISAARRVTITANAQLAETGALSGTVTADNTGLPLSNVEVDAYELATGATRSNVTNAAGVFKFAGLNSGIYKIRFYDMSGNYKTEYYDDKPNLTTADPVTVTSGMTTTLNAALARGGCVTGRVTDATTGQGIGGVSVRALRKDASTTSGRATTDANGYYTTTTGLYTGVYQVSFHPPQPYWSEYYDNQYYFNPTPTWVTVTAPLTTPNINAALKAGYLITGLVTGPGPLSGVLVSAYRGPSSTPIRNAVTAEDGAYRLGPLEPGQYRVRFGPSDTHASEWYNDSPSYVGATLVNLTGNVANVNAELIQGGRITGQVTKPDGALLPYASIRVYPAGSSVAVASAWSNDGNYATTPGLAEGLYQVYFYAPSGYVSEWHDDQPSQATAQIISVTTGATVNVNAQLNPITVGPSGAITGVVTAADTGLPLAAWVYVYTPNGNYVGYVYAPDGHYVLRLAAGVYRLQFYVSLPYLSRYYDNKLAWANADPITVTANMTTTNINQIIPRGGAITGTVTAFGGVPGVLVSAQLASASSPYRSAYTGIDGAFNLSNLEPGSTVLKFRPPAPYAPASVNVSVISSATIAANTVLTAGGVITGRVTAADSGASLPGIAVNISSTNSIYYAHSDMDGYYQTPGLPPGNYTVLFKAGAWPNYLAQWYNNGAPVAVPAISTTANINAALERGGSLSGWTYSALNRLPLSGVYANVYNIAGANVTGEQSNAWGFYQIQGLASGAYKVQFSSGNYKLQWYDNASDFGAALSVTVSAPDDTPNINVYLRYPHEIYLPLVLRK